ncbi:MAG: hypothetical protein K5979_12285 [Ruminococcus sp.]|nr:hypothetical protein [Ruminococcus sp.]
MIKFCDLCGKDFNGEGHICPECQKKQSAVVSTSKPNSILKKVTIIIVSFFILIILFLVLAMISSLSKLSNKQCETKFKELCKTFSSDVFKGADYIDSDGTIIYGDDIIYYLNSDNTQDNNNALYVSEYIEKDFSYSKRLNWVIVCDKESGKISHVSFTDKKSTNTDIENAAKLKSDEAQLKEDYDKIASSIQKSKDIYFNEAINYCPDVFDASDDDYAICTNIDNTNSNSELYKELSKKYSGYWIVVIFRSGTEKIYYADDLETEFVGSMYIDDIADLDNNTLLTAGGIKSILERYPDLGYDFILKDEWENKYAAEIEAAQEAYIKEKQEKEAKEKVEKQKAYENERDSLSKKTFTGNRKLDNLRFFKYNDERDFTNDRLTIISIDAEIQNNNLVLNISAKNNMEIKRRWFVTVGYYNAAGELKGKFECDMDYIPGLGTRDCTFIGEPNCIDYLAYYRIISIMDSQ